MSLLQVLVLSDAQSSPSQTCICPGCPLLWLKDCTKEGRRELTFPFYFFFAFVTHLLDISPLTTHPPPAHLYLILLAMCTPSMSVSLLATPSLPFPLTRVDYLSLFCCSLFHPPTLLSPVNSLFFSACTTPFQVAVSSSRFPAPPQLLLFISSPSLSAIIVPL